MRLGRIGIGVGITVAAAATGRRVTACRFSGRLAGYGTELRTPASSGVDPADLPPVVVRWLEQALPAERPCPALVRLDQAFEMRLREGGRWSPGTAVHLAAGGHPGFAWFGHVQLAPLLGVHVYDALVAGEGFLDARLWGVVPIARARGAAATRGELQRYLAELPWTPSAVLTNPELRWDQVGERTVDVSATLGAVEGSVSLEFGEDGLPTGGFAAARPRTEGTLVVERPWRGVFSEYRERRGMLLPAHGEVAWQLDGEWSPYWRGTVTDISFPQTN